MQSVSEAEAVANEAENATEAAMAAANEAERAAKDAMAAADAALAEAGEKVVSDILSADDLSKVCRAAIAKTFNESPSVMRVIQNENGIVRIHYNRTSDKSLWKNDCRILGDVVQWRGVDSTPYSKLGPWHPNGYDETLTFRIEGNKVDIFTDWGDGDKERKTYTVN